jgi:hypothetical protein
VCRWQLSELNKYLGDTLARAQQKAIKKLDSTGLLASGNASEVGA